MIDLQEVQDLLLSQLDGYTDNEILEGVSLGICLYGRSDLSWGLDTNGKSPQAVVEEIESANTLFDLHFPYPHCCQEDVGDWIYNWAKI